MPALPGGGGLTEDHGKDMTSLRPTMMLVIAERIVRRSTDSGSGRDEMWHRRTLQVKRLCEVASSTVRTLPYLFGTPGGRIERQSAPLRLSSRSTTPFGEGDGPWRW
jgi:hypothetical protein